MLDYIYSVAILKCLSKSQRIFLKASISPGFQEQQNGDQTSPRGGGGDDQSSPTECKERLLKTNTLLRREGVIRILVWGIMLFLS